MLTGLEIHSTADQENAVDDLRNLGATAVLLKGGHLEGNSVRDLLIEKNSVTVFENDRIQSRHTHGTGCTLASAIASGIADGMEVSSAVSRAIAYVQKAIQLAPGLGKGHGPLNHGHTVNSFGNS